MIDNTFIQSPEYQDYLDNKEEISKESVVFVEDKEKLITQEHEYLFVPSGGSEGLVLQHTENGVEWEDPTEGTIVTKDGEVIGELVIADSDDNPYALVTLENLDSVKEELEKKIANSSGLPEGGEVGQVLTKTDTGVEWKDIDTNTDADIYTITLDSEEGYLPEGEYKRILDAYNKSKRIAVNFDGMTFYVAGAHTEYNYIMLHGSIPGIFITVSIDASNESYGLHLYEAVSKEDADNNYATKEELEQAKSDVKDELIGTAPGTYNTLGEIADYIEEHGEVAAAMAADIATKAPKSMFWTGTSSEYELITTKDPTTLYFIIEE